MPGFSLKELIGRIYLLLLEPNGQYFRAKIVKILKEKDDHILSHPDYIQFWLQVPMDNTKKLLLIMISYLILRRVLMSLVMAQIGCISSGT